MIQGIIKRLFDKIIPVDRIEFFYKGLDSTNKEKLDKEIIKRIKNEANYDKSISINILGIFKHIDLPKTARNTDVNKNICLEYAKENFPNKIIDIKLDNYPINKTNTIDLCIVYEAKKLTVKEHLKNVFKNFKDDKRVVIFRSIDSENRLLDKMLPVNKMLEHIDYDLIMNFCIHKDLKFAPGEELFSIYDFTENHIKQYFEAPDYFFYEFHGKERARQRGL